MIPGISDTPLVGTDTGSYAGGSSDTQTVYVGASGSAVNDNRQRGYIQNALGNISDGTSNLYAGAQIKSLYAAENISSGGGLFDVILSIAGTLSNFGWNTMNVGGSFVLSRSSAMFTTGGGVSTWTWEGAGNPFGSAGAIRVVGFD